MKRVLLALLTIQFFVLPTFAGNCVLEKSLSFFPSTSICLFKKDSLNFRNKKNVEPPVVNLQRGGNLWMYRSHLNPMIVVTTDGRRVVLSNICEKDPLCDSLDTHIPFLEVLKDEFLRWQKASVFEGTEQEADSLVSHIIEKMSKGFGEEDEMSKDFGEEDGLGEPRLMSTEYNIYCDDTDSAVSILGPFYVLHWGKPTVLDSLYLCDEYTLGISEIPVSGRSLGIRRISKGAFAVDGLKEVSAYKVFDLNGILLEQGYTQDGLLEVNHAPAVLEISNKRFLLK